ARRPRSTRVPHPRRELRACTPTICDRGRTDAEAQPRRPPCRRRKRPPHPRRELRACTPTLCDRGRTDAAAKPRRPPCRRRKRPPHPRRELRACTPTLATSDERPRRELTRRRAVGSYPTRTSGPKYTHCPLW